MTAPLRSGSRARNEQAGVGAAAASTWDREWQAAEATDRLEAEQARARTRAALAVVAPAAVVAALLPAILPLTPGFSAAETLAAVIAAFVAAAVAIGIVPLADWSGREIPGAGAGDSFVFAAALL